MTIEVGGVYIIHNDTIGTPKTKLNICVSIQKDWFLFVNSENRKIYDCIPMYKRDNPFLKHDSFVSCSRVFSYTKAELKKAKKVGDIAISTIEDLIEKIETSEVLEQVIIDEIISSLEETID